MTSRIPPLLEPYLALPPESSLILLTNVLGASSNWLILRFLYNILNSKQDQDDRETKVLLASFMRDFAFWRENAKRIGLDLDKLALKKKFLFVDGLSRLFVPRQPKAPPSKVGEKFLGNPELAQVSSELLKSIQELQAEGGRVILIIDQLDLLLATTAGNGHGSMELADVLTEWRENVHATILSLAADLPLVAEQNTPLERDHANFLLSIAHEADFTMGLRLLDTGTARDVSGVIRIAVSDESSCVVQKIEEAELLYFVGGDGGVKVFERGQ